MMYFTADTHFGHEAIMHMAKRSFSSVAAMNTQLIDRINERVGAKDSLYVLGDFCYELPLEAATRLRERIACEHVHLVLGNHDGLWREHPDEAAELFESVAEYREIEPGYAHGHRLVLFHYPMLTWCARWRASIHLHGHIHGVGDAGNRRNRERHILRYDVGVDANGYYPVSRDEILAFFDGVEPGRPSAR